MTTFVDTSAFYAVLDGNDISHARAAKVWRSLLTEESHLLTNNYVLLETGALLQTRLGIVAVKTFYQDIFPLLTVDWISGHRHQAGVEAALASARRKLSVVDCVSFQTMREHGVQTVFCFDKHFREQGFDTVP